MDGDRSQGIEIRSLHGITPETENTTHYFWGYARNFALDDAPTTEMLRNGRSGRPSPKTSMCWSTSSARSMRTPTRSASISTATPRPCRPGAFSTS